MPTGYNTQISNLLRILLIGNCEAPLVMQKVLWIKSKALSLRSSPLLWYFVVKCLATVNCSYCGNVEPGNSFALPLDHRWAGKESWLNVLILRKEVVICSRKTINNEKLIMNTYSWILTSDPLKNEKSQFKNNGLRVTSHELQKL